MGNDVTVLEFLVNAASWVVIRTERLVESLSS
jgi:hypothetical protein